MSRKTITFGSPTKRARAAAAREPAAPDAQGETAADRWVYQLADSQAPASKAARKRAETEEATVTISISTEPDPFEVMKILFLLPYLTFSFWTLCAAQRSLRFFGR